MLQFCRKHSCKLVYAGSSTKFGDGGLGRTQTPYGWTKAANTELVKCFGDWFNLDYAVTYFYNVFGGREIRQVNMQPYRYIYRTRSKWETSSGSNAIIKDETSPMWMILYLA